MTPERMAELLAQAGADIQADLPYLTEAEIYGLCLFLARLAGS